MYFLSFSSLDLKLQTINKIVNTLTLFLNMLSAWIKENLTLNKRGRLLQNRGKPHTHNKRGKLSYFGRKLKTLIWEKIKDSYLRGK